MAKQKNLEDIYYPVPQNFCITQPEKPPINRDVIKLIIRGAVKGAYKLENPSDYDLKYGNHQGNHSQYQLKSKWTWSFIL